MGGGSYGDDSFPFNRMPYTSSFQGGAQEGRVAVYMYSQANGSIATAAIVKVMM